MLGPTLALVACLMYGGATLLQAAGTRRAEGLGAFVQPLVVVGLVIDGLAFGVSLLAYEKAPLFEVQTIIAAAVVVSVLGAPRVLPGVALRRVDLVGAAVVVLGLVVVAAAAGPDASVEPPSGFVTVLLVLTGVLVVATAASYRWAPSWLMAVLAGLGFSLVAVGARPAEDGTSFWQMVLSPIALVVLGGGAVGVVGNIRALERGSVAIAASVVSVIEVVIPSVIGIAVLGDGVRSGWGVPLVLGIAVALGGCVLLSASPANTATEAASA